MIKDLVDTISEAQPPRSNRWDEEFRKHRVHQEYLKDLENGRDRAIIPLQKAKAAKA